VSTNKRTVWLTALVSAFVLPTFAASPAGAQAHNGRPWANNVARPFPVANGRVVLASPRPGTLIPLRGSVAWQGTLRWVVKNRVPGVVSTGRFHRLARQWQEETAVHSSTTIIARHPAYRAIIAMGRPAVPLILRSLARSPDHWFEALRTITGEDPVRPESRDCLDAMAADWLVWGRARGLVR
jgi:hypothetical protein